MRRRVASLVVVAVSVAGCGSDGSMGADARASIDTVIGQVRVAASERRPDVAAQRLVELRALVDALRQEGAVDDGQVAEILAAVREVEAQLHLVVPPTTTSSTTTTAVPVAAPDGGRRDDERDKGGPDEKKGGGRKKDG